jgi:hypothetical protein
MVQALGFRLQTGLTMLGRATLEATANLLSICIGPL